MTKIIAVSEVENNKEEILSVLKNSGVILYPTDTQYGLGAIASSKEGVQKVRDIKMQSEDKPISIIVSNTKMAKRYVEVSKEAEELMVKHLPGALTLVLPSKDKDLAKNRGHEYEIGVRIPDQKEILKLVKELDLPITTTSSNITGQQPESTVEKILEQLNTDEIDLAIDAGELSGDASTIVQVNGSGVNVLREGKIKISS